MTMTAEAKRRLSSTIRDLRERLLEDLKGAVDGAYRLSVPSSEAGIDERARARRARLEAWLGEQVRAQRTGKGLTIRTAEDFRRDAEKQAAYTLLNRLVILRIMEAVGLRKAKLVTGSSESPIYKDFRRIAPALTHDDTEGYDFLLQQVFEELAMDMPGLFGPAGVADLVPVPAATLKHAIATLDDPALATCWDDDMTLGWIYQYWNDPEREALDAKLNAGGKVEPHEIASKTQMFTERYMVDWLLQNSLGPMWLSMCKKHGWTPEVEADGTLQNLEERRVDWRRKREAGEVSLTELMPLYTEAERRWAYYVPQSIPEDAVIHAPASVRELKLLDPAVGSGHFLVVAFDLLVALYREEARHRGETGDERWSDRAIVENILEHNLHGIDIDPRAVQIAAAALWLKCRQTCLEARPHALNLVASNLNLASLPDDDPALVELRNEVERETGIPGELTDTIVHALRGADHLGSLLRVDKAVESALEAHEAKFGHGEFVQGRIWGGFGEASDGREAVKATIQDRLEGFLERHSTGNDLGLRLRGEQLAVGVRFARLVREGGYHLVVGNPPYQGTAKMADAKYIQTHYSRGKADLYAAFLERALQLVAEGGTSALLTMRNWMFIKQFLELRVWLLENFDLRALGDFDRGAFEEVPDEVVSIVISIFRRSPAVVSGSIALQPTDLVDRTRDNERTSRKRAAVHSHVGIYAFHPNELRAIPDWPLVYWWDSGLLEAYRNQQLLGDVSPARAAQSTGDNSRFGRLVWETINWNTKPNASNAFSKAHWVPFVNGGKGRQWFEPAVEVVNWSFRGFPVKISKCHKTGIETCSLASEEFFFRIGIAFSKIGASFSARVHRYPSVFSDAGSSVFPDDIPSTIGAMNSSRARIVLESLNPTINFQVGDVNRLPIFPIQNADYIFSLLEYCFIEHESHRESSVEFKHPGPSQWNAIQRWAQGAVDLPQGAAPSSYESEYDLEPPTDHVSFALGVALGRFGANGEGILAPDKDDLSQALPDGILFLDGTLDANDTRDCLGHPATAPLHSAWASFGPAIAPTEDLRTWLRLRFFTDVHKGMYENRPIHWPLSSEKKTFVAWINIHRWNEQTLRLLLADHLQDALTRLEGELADLRAARDGANKQAAREAEKRAGSVLKARDELVAFIELVTQCAEKGAPPTDAKCPPREKDARYAPDLDDGVMINSAALWPLLEPQWKNPKTWWKELATSQGKKDYDWSHLAMRYWPTRVDKKCQADPSLGVAHGCFWKYHPARAWAWELRLQDEIGPDFKIVEEPYRVDGGDAEHRAAYLRDHAKDAIAAIEKEALRRRGRGKASQPVAEMRILEGGLWRDHAKLCWEMELRVAVKQGADFRLLAPDEPEARAVLLEDHPELTTSRMMLVAGLTPSIPEPAEDDEETAEDEPEREEELV